MDAHILFDYIGYFHSMTRSNLLAIDNGFFPCTCSGWESLEGPLAEFANESAFVCVDDTSDASIFRGRSGGYFYRRTLTVFIMHRYEFGDESDRIKQFELCRSVFRQFLSRMLIDQDRISNDNIYLATENIKARSIGQYALNGATGIYFMIDVSEPVDLKYDKAQWL